MILFEDLLLYIFFCNSDFKVRIHNAFADRKVSLLELTKIACRLRNLKLIDAEFTKTGGLRAQLTKAGLKVVEKLILPHRNNIFPAKEPAAKFMLTLRYIEFLRLKRIRKPYQPVHISLIKKIAEEKSN